MDSIKKVSIGELKANKEELLNSMKGLAHTAKDIFGSTPFKDEYIAVGTDHILTIEVGGSIYPVHYTPNTMAMLDGDLSITDYIFDEENCLSLSDDDDMRWFSLVMQLAHQIDLLQNENNQYREDLTTVDNKIDKLEVDNKRLSERVKTLVIEKSKLEKSDDDRTEKPASEIIKECVGDSSDLTEKLDAVYMDLETATLLQENAKLKEEIQSFKETSGQYIDRTTSLLEENGKLKEKIQSLKDSLRERISEYDRKLSVFKREKEEAELLAYRLTKGEMCVQFDNMKSLEHENGVLKDENADLNQKLWQNGYHITYSAHSEEADEDNEDMQQTITQETMAELRGKIKELVSKLKDKDERINQLSKNNAALSAENKNLNEMIKNADRDARFYAREVDHLRQENDKIYSILNDAAKVVRERNKQE